MFVFYFFSGVVCVIIKSKVFEIWCVIVVLGKLWLIYVLKKLKVMYGNEKNERRFFFKDMNFL